MRLGPMSRQHLILVATLAILAVVFAGLATTLRAVDRAADSHLPALRTEGADVLDERGQRVQLIGVNLPDLEWSDDERLLESLEEATRFSQSHAVRLPLSQDRWFGQALDQTDGGAQYRRTVDDVVDRANRNGSYVVLDLHSTNGGQWERQGGYAGRHCMPDQHSTRFWAAVASRYAQRPGVLFGLFDEPFEIDAAVWRNGGPVAEQRWIRSREGRRPELFASCGDRRPSGPGWTALGISTYDAPGMQELYDIVRAADAQQPVLVGGIRWTDDPTAGAIDGFNVVYEGHAYPSSDQYPERVAASGLIERPIKSD
jgi:endoglucanase